MLNAPATVGLRYLAVTAASIALVVIMTWPLGRVTEVTIPASDDAHFSIWRLAWIAHQLPSDPAHLFDANIYHPAKGTLALSDAMLLVGVAGTPFFRLGVDAGLIHNGLLLGAIVLSMLCAFALASRLTGSPAAAFVAAIIFGLAPYRFAHIGHLELQWTMWMPLSMLLLHRLIEKPSFGRAVQLGSALTAQFFCSIYYGLFLGCYVALAWLILVAIEKTRRQIVIASLAVVLPLLLVPAIYGPPYAATRAQFGDRQPDEVSSFSAEPRDYLRVPPENMLFGNRSDPGPAPDERSLFPGAIAIALAALAFFPPVSRLAWIYLAAGLVALDFSLGSHGFLFPVVHGLPFVANLRSPARFGVLVLLSIAMLAAMGATRMLSRWPRMASLGMPLVTLVCVLEYWSAPVTVRSFDSRPSAAHAWLAQNPPGSVVLELPVPTATTLWLYESSYQVGSIAHWQPLVNGYGAFPPEHYSTLLNELTRFPEPDVIDALRRINVRFILINRGLYAAGEFDRLMAAVASSSRLWPSRQFGEGQNQTLVVELRPNE